MSPWWLLLIGPLFFSAGMLFLAVWAEWKGEDAYQRGRNDERADWLALVARIHRDKTDGTGEAVAR